MAWYGDKDIFLRAGTTGFTHRVNNPFVYGISAGTKVSGKKNQYNEGDIIARYTTSVDASRTNASGQLFVGTAQKTAISAMHMKASYNAPICILLLKKNNIPYTNQGYQNGFVEWGEANGVFVNTPYIPHIMQYYVSSYGEITRSEISNNFDPKPKGGLQEVFSTLVPENIKAEFNQKDMYDMAYGMGNAFTFLGSRLGQWVAGMLRGKDSVLQWNYYPDETINKIDEQLEELTGKVGESAINAFKNRCWIAAPPTYGYIVRDFVCACQVSASVPIFMDDQLEEMYDYFVNDKGGGVNGDDLKLSDVGLATDWKIYVNGQRSPDITVTMNSSNIDSYLEDKEQNTGGYAKSDFKIQYKAPSWKIDGLSVVAGKGLEDSLKEYEEKTLAQESYDNAHSTSWELMTDINYRNKDEYSIIIDEWANMEMYAQLFFRVRLSDTLFSSWCEMKIGYIGTPSVEDFSKMKNFGGIMEGVINDGSTVEIIYDQTPPEEDDYEDPEDIIPDPSETEPSGYDLGGTGLTQTYKVTDTQLKQLGEFLWGASFIDDIKLVNNNPIENIVGCKRIPFDIPAGVARNIVMGNVTAPASGNIISQIPIINIGEIVYNGYYGNFLDYSPYTRLILFLPFCGFTEIDPSIITGKRMSIKYAIDVIMGKCRAMVFVEGAYYASYDGNFGVEMALTGSNRAQVDAGLVASVASIGAGAYFAPAGMAEKVAKAAVGGIETAVASQYHSTRTGSYSSTCAWQETRKCFMIADIPTCQYPTSYGHDRGYPCMLTRTLATMRGFTICSTDIDLSGLTCTEEEINMIREYLVGGIYL